MVNRRAEATWRGDLEHGEGVVKLDSGLGARMSYGARTGVEPTDESNPEELIGAAHAACFSMMLASELTRAGYKPDLIHTRADVVLDSVEGDPEITEIHLDTSAVVPKIDEARFRELAEHAKNGCPVSKLVKGGARISLDARLAVPKSPKGTAPAHESAP